LPRQQIQPNSDRWNAAATTTTETRLETKKKLALLPFYNVLLLLLVCCTEKNVRKLFKYFPFQNRYITKIFLCFIIKHNNLKILLTLTLLS